MGREGGEGTNNIESKYHAILKKKKNNPQPKNPLMKLLRIMIAYERVVAAGGVETEDDHDIVYQSLIHPIMLLLSPNLPQNCKA